MRGQDSVRLLMLRSKDGAASSSIILLSETVLYNFDFATVALLPLLLLLPFSESELVWSF